MKSLMETNVYSLRGRVLIAGSCLPEVFPEAFEQLAAEADQVFSLCLEQTHVNMAITKLTAVLGTGQVTSLRFATVDRSPHCVQMHYIPHEIERVMPEHIPMERFVVSESRIWPVSEQAVELSKTLRTLTSMTEEDIRK